VLIKAASSAPTPAHTSALSWLQAVALPPVLAAIAAQQAPAFVHTLQSPLGAPAEPLLLPALPLPLPPTLVIPPLPPLALPSQALVALVKQSWNASQVPLVHA